MNHGNRTPGIVTTNAEDAEALWKEIASIRGGFTEDELSAAFSLVKNQKDWKLPIDAVVPISTSRELITRAVIYYTGSIPEFQATANGLRVVATGYYAEIES